MTPSSPGDQQSVIDTAHARQHVREEFSCPAHDKARQHIDHPAAPIGVAQIDSHPAFFFPADGRPMPVPPGARRAAPWPASGSCTIISAGHSINRLSSSRQRIVQQTAIINTTGTACARPPAPPADFTAPAARGGSVMAPGRRFTGNNRR